MADIPNLFFIGRWSFCVRYEVPELQVMSSMNLPLLGTSKVEVEASSHRTSSRDPEKGLCYPNLNLATAEMDGKPVLHNCNIATSQGSFGSLGRET